MFIGHFGVSLAAKKIAPEINLGVFFVAGQLLDLIWPVLVLTGLEQVSVDHSATVVTPLNFLHYPYSHSLMMTLLYSVIMGVIISRIFKSLKFGIVTGFVVFSHWILDFITHRPDLPLFFGDTKYGLGLWNSLMGTLVVEITIFVVGIILYLKSAVLINRNRKIIFWSLIGFLSLIYAGNVFGPKVPMDTPANAIAGPALAMWLIVFWGYWAEQV